MHVGKGLCAAGEDVLPKLYIHHAVFIEESI